MRSPDSGKTVVFSPADPSKFWLQVPSSSPPSRYTSASKLPWAVRGLSWLIQLLAALLRLPASGAVAMRWGNMKKWQPAVLP